MSIKDFDADADSTVVFHKNTDLFKRVDNTWQYFYRNDENIRDIQPLDFTDNQGLFVISDGKITRWTNFVPAKYVYLKVRDAAGNESDTSVACSTVSLDLQSIKDFIPTGRILDIDEYGNIVYSFDSVDNRLFYGGDLIDAEIGTYESEIFNGSNSLVSWQSIRWQATEPTGTSVNMQVRTGASEDEVLDADWTDNLLVNSEGFVSLEFYSDQYLQYRAILRSTVRDISPTLHTVTVRNLTAAASHFFSTNFILPKRVVSGILTENSVIPVSADIVFGINTLNSVEFTDYQIIEPNRIFTTDSRQFGENLRVGCKLISPGYSSPNSQDPYTNITHSCQIAFDFTNTDTSTKTFQFRIEFYNDVQRTQLQYTFFSGNDQTGWSFGNEVTFPAAGISIPPESQRSLLFVPGDEVASGQVYYLKIEAYDGSAFEDVQLRDAYVCDLPGEYEYGAVNIPILKNLSITFSMEDGTQIKVNI